VVDVGGIETETGKEGPKKVLQAKDNKGQDQGPALA